MTDCSWQRDSLPNCIIILASPFSQMEQQTRTMIEDGATWTASKALFTQLSQRLLTDVKTTLVHLKEGVLLLLLLCLAEGQRQHPPPKQKQCNIEECLLKLRDPDPVKEGDIKIFCARTAEGLSCLDRCLDSPIYQATSPIVMGGVKQLLSEICAPGSSLGKRYLQESKCLNHQNTTIMECATSMIEKYPSLIQRPDPESIIKVFCCSIDRTEECIVERVHKDCGRGAAKLVNEMMGRAFYPINQVICYFNNPAQCPQF